MEGRARAWFLLLGVFAVSTAISLFASPASWAPGTTAAQRHDDILARQRPHGLDALPLGLDSVEGGEASETAAGEGIKRLIHHVLEVTDAEDVQGPAGAGGPAVAVPGHVPPPPPPPPAAVPAAIPTGTTEYTDFRACGKDHGQDREACLVRLAARNRTVVVVSVGKGFIEGAVNWFGFVRAHGLEDNVVVLALDEAAFEFFDARGAAVVHLPPPTGDYGKTRRTTSLRQHLWVSRTEFVLRLLRRGLAVVQSDVDALWIRNPLPALWAPPPNVGAVFSRADPGVVCMGFVMFRSLPGTISLLEDALKVMVDDAANDQAAVNTVLRRDARTRADLTEMMLAPYRATHLDMGWSALTPGYALRHGGLWTALVDPAYLEMGVWHPSGHGYVFPSFALRRPLTANEDGRRFEAGATKPVSELCPTPKWSERTSLADSIPSFKCAGVWLNDGDPNSVPVVTEQPFGRWLEVATATVTGWLDLPRPAFVRPDFSRLSRRVLPPAPAPSSSTEGGGAITAACTSDGDIDCVVERVTERLLAAGPGGTKAGGGAVVLLHIGVEELAWAVNWLAMARHSGLLPHVVCLPTSPAIVAFLRARGAPALLLSAALRHIGRTPEDIPAQKQLWAVVEHVVGARGTAALVADVRTLIFVNPLPAMLARSEDAVFIREDVGNLGADVMLLKPSAATAVFVEAVATKLKSQPTISTAINVVIREGRTDTRSILMDALIDPFSATHATNHLRWVALPHLVFHRHGGHWMGYVHPSKFALAGWRPDSVHGAGLPVGLLPLFGPVGAEAQLQTGARTLGDECGAMWSKVKVRTWTDAAGQALLRCLGLWLVRPKEALAQLPASTPLDFGKWLDEARLEPGAAAAAPPPRAQPLSDNDRPGPAGGGGGPTPLERRTTPITGEAFPDCSACVDEACLVERAKRNGTVIVTAITYGFVEGYFNWLTLQHRLGLASMNVAIAFDIKSHEFLRQRGGCVVKAPLFEREGTEHLNKVRARRVHIWRERTRILRRLLGQHVNVLFSDVDAMFMRDPLPLLHATPGDIVFSRGKQGELCLGFAFYRPTAATLGVLDQAVGLMEEHDFNDQEAINLILRAEPGQAPKDARWSRALSQMTVEAETSFERRVGDLRFVAIPQTQFLRTGGPWTFAALKRGAMDVYVFHPNPQGWDHPVQVLPEVSVRDHLLGAKSLKMQCKPPGWAERLNMNDEAEALRCCALWVIADDILQRPAAPGGMQSWLLDIARNLRLLDGSVVNRVPPTAPFVALLPGAGAGSPVIARPAEEGCLASFLIIGTRKGGTTSLYQYLAKHPRVAGVRLDRRAQAGELFFSWRPQEGPGWDEQLRRSYNDLYRNEFKRKQTAFDPSIHITGESTVVYNTDCLVPRAVRQACGADMKLIMLVREPVARMVSLFNMRVRLHARGYTEATNITQLFEAELDEFLRMEAKAGPGWHDQSPPACLTNKPPPMNGVWESLYAVHLRRWRQHFPRAQIKVVVSEDLFARPAAEVGSVLSFLGLDLAAVDLADVTSQVFNAKTEDQARGAVPPQHVLAAATRERLNREVFARFNRLLAEEWSLELAPWRSRGQR